jgi:hypothetical protein
VGSLFFRRDVSPPIILGGVCNVKYVDKHSEPCLGNNIIPYEGEPPPDILELQFLRHLVLNFSDTKVVSLT